MSEHKKWEKSEQRIWVDVKCGVWGEESSKQTNVEIIMMLSDGGEEKRRFRKPRLLSDFRVDYPSNRWQPCSRSIIYLIDMALERASDVLKHFSRAERNASVIRGAEGKLRGRDLWSNVFRFLWKSLLNLVGSVAWAKTFC